MDFWFSLKKLLSIYLNPITAIMELIFIGLALVIAASRSPRRPLSPRLARLRSHAGDMGVFLIGFGLFIFFLASLDPIAHRLVLSVEEKTPPLPEQAGVPQVETQPEFIVILAGGQRSSLHKPPLSSLTHHGFARVVGGVDLWKNFPKAQLIVTGHPDETEAMRAVAERLGVPPHQITEEKESRDTKDHPLMLKPLLGDSPFLLVTSGVHMPRSAALFQSAGLHPDLAPVDFIIWPQSEDYDPYRPGALIPRAFNLYLSSTAVHEICGMVWSKWKGEIATPSSS